ncbi:MAG: aminopeptidase P family protein [Phycisphaerales bacterium]|nr:MAG: aminopeptidase P family protein [Phycisphaerales bacterium]
MREEILQTRRRNIRRQLRKRNIDGLILTKSVDVTYVTAFAGHDSWALLTKNAVYLITDSRYTEQAHNECLQTTIVERRGFISEATGRLVRRLKSLRSVALSRSISLAAYETLKKSVAIPLKKVDGLLTTARSIKDKVEIAAIKTAANTAAVALENTKPFFKPGIAEIELAGILDLEIRRLGSKNGFETIVAFGPNASRPHHQPSRRKLHRTDTILIDFGATCKGYTSDITRCFAVGKPTAAYRHAYEVVTRAQAASIATARAGAELVAVDAAAREVIRDSGLPVHGHGGGHGIGLEIHEIPFLKEDAQGTLQAGQIITIEPGVYIPGKLGVRLEDDILITDKGCQILTRRCPHAELPI